MIIVCKQTLIKVELDLLKMNYFLVYLDTKIKQHIDVKKKFDNNIKIEGKKE